MTDVATRVCSICEVEKPIETGFYKSGAPRKDGTFHYKTFCRQCDNKSRSIRDKEKRMPMHSVDVRYKKTQHDLPPTSDVAAVEETLDKPVADVLESAPALDDNAIYNAAQTIVSCGDELRAVQRELDDTKAMLREIEAKYNEVKTRWLEAVKVIQGHGATDRNE